MLHIVRRYQSNIEALHARSNRYDMDIIAAATHVEGALPFCATSMVTFIEIENALSVTWRFY